VGEIGHLHNLPTSRAEKFSALAVHEQIGLTPREDDARDRACQYQFSAAAGP
jgi:hypothetical protein